MDFSPIVLAHAPAFRIGKAEFRPATREVDVEGSTAVIEPRVMQLLIALHRADGAVVSKDDLALTCWEGRVVGEDAINRVVSRLRSVAEKQAAGQFRIETITKVGYRLVPGGGSSEARRQLPSPERRKLVIGGAVAGVALAGGGGWILFNRSHIPSDAQALVDDARAAMNYDTVEQNSNAVGKLRQAADLAPDSAEVWGVLALAYQRQAAQAPASDRRDLQLRGMSAAKRALAILPHQPDAQAAMILAMPEFRNWIAYDRACRTALRTNPDHPELQLAMAELLCQVGRYRECLDLLEAAFVHKPAGPRLSIFQVLLLWDLGRIDEAESALGRAFARWPRHYAVWFTRLYFLMFTGRPNDAAAMIADTPSRPIGIPDWNYDLTAGQVNAIQSGDGATIAKAVTVSENAASKGTGFAENGAIFAAYVGNLDAAFRILNGLYFNRGFVMPDTYFAKEQGMYQGRERHTYNLFKSPSAALMKDPRFAVLTRELGLDDYWRRTGSRSKVISYA